MKVHIVAHKAGSRGMDYACVDIQYTECNV